MPAQSDMPNVWGASRVRRHAQQGPGRVVTAEVFALCHVMDRQMRTDKWMYGWIRCIVHTHLCRIATTLGGRPVSCTSEAALRGGLH